MGTNYTRTKPDVPTKNAGNLRARFENMAQQSTEEAKARAEEEKRKRELKDKKDREEAAKREAILKQKQTEEDQNR